MTNHNDPWHYQRRDLANKLLRRFDPGPAELITLFAERRTGKTAFLQNDLSPAALTAGLQPVYVDLWAHRANPGRGLADAFEEAAKAVRDPDYKYGSIIGRFNDDVASVGAFGVSLGLKPRADRNAPDDSETIPRIGFWSNRLMAASKRPVLLMVDEVQTIAAADDGVNIASALRAAMQRHGRMNLKPVFTGSSRDGLDRMFTLSDAPFFRYGVRDELPPPDDGIAAFFAGKLKASSGINASVPALVAAFNELDRRPGPFREMVEAMDQAADNNVDKYLQRQIGAMQAMSQARLALSRLKPVDAAILEHIATGGGEIFSKETNVAISAKVGVDALNNKTLLDSVNRLRDLGMVVKSGRGQYEIEDQDIAALVANGNGLATRNALLQGRAGGGLGKLPTPNATYTGPILAIDADRVVQDAGVAGKINHSRASLYRSGGGVDKLLQLGQAVKITYRTSGQGQVENATQDSRRSLKR
jgi:hypothetical protein